MLLSRSSLCKKNNIMCVLIYDNFSYFIVAILIFFFVFFYIFDVWPKVHETVVCSATVVTVVLLFLRTLIMLYFLQQQIKVLTI